MLREEQVNKCDAFFAKSFMSEGIVRAVPPLHLLLGSLI
jgi:hypothetical protein